MSEPFSKQVTLCVYVRALLYELVWVVVVLGKGSSVYEEGILRAKCGLIFIGEGEGA